MVCALGLEGWKGGERWRGLRAVDVTWAGEYMFLRSVNRARQTGGGHKNSGCQAPFVT